jgi:MFS family permease
MIKVPQWLNRNVFGFSLASFFSDVSQEMSLALLPTFLMTLVSQAAAPISMGIISGVSEAVAYATRLPFGWLSDRYNHKKLLIGTGYGLSGLFLATISLATHAWHVLLARSMSRLGKGMRDPARDSLLAKSVEKDHYGAAFGFNRALDTLGAVMGLVLLEFIAPYFSVRSLFVVCAAPAFLAVLTIVLVVNIKNNVRNHNYPLSFFAFFRKMPTVFLVFVGIVGLFSIVYAHVTLFLMFTQYFFKFGTTQAIRFGAFLYIIFNIVRFVTEGMIGIASDYVNRYVLLAIMSYGSFALDAF